MPLPIRMNLMRVVIQQLDFQEVVLDNDFREVVGEKVRSDPIILQGQVNLASDKDYKPYDATRTGDKEPTEGRIYFKKSHLDEKGVSLNKGDMIVSVGPEGRETILNCPIQQIRPESPYRGDFLLTCVEFNYDYEQRESIQ